MLHQWVCLFRIGFMFWIFFCVTKFGIKTYVLILKFVAGVNREFFLGLNILFL